MTPSAPFSAISSVESRVADAIQYLDATPGASIRKVAEEFGVSRQRLSRQLEGIPSKSGRPAANTKLSREEEADICRYIDRLGQASFAVRPEFITDAANHIL